MQTTTITPLLGALLALVGCASIHQGPVGKLLLTQRDDLANSLAPPHSKASTSLADRYMVANGSGSRKDRNDLVWDLLHLIDINYVSYEQNAFSSNGWFNFTSNTINLGLTTASTLSGAQGVKTTLSALATAVTGTHAEFDRSILHDQVIPALVAKMRADRATKYAEIRGRLNESTARYPVGEAMRDIIEYYEAGTLEGTFGEITRDAAQQEQKADDSAENVRKKGPP